MEKVIQWLLTGDVTIQYQTHRDLLQSDNAALHALQQRMETEGFASQILQSQNENGHWGLHYYQPKWTSTHYTLLELKTMRLSPDVQACREMTARTLEDCMLDNGGMNLSKHEHKSDMGVNGMVLNYAVYFGNENPRILRLLSYILANQKTDGGFHWDESSESSEPHTTICVLEGLGEYLAWRLPNRQAEVERAIAKGVEFLLCNQLFMLNIDSRFLKLSYPYRYRYDLLRALEFFAVHGIPFDRRMLPALQWLKGKHKLDGKWFLENIHKGKVHYIMEMQGEPSRWITLNALLILKQYGLELTKGETNAV